MTYFDREMGENPVEMEASIEHSFPQRVVLAEKF